MKKGKLYYAMLFIILFLLITIIGTLIYTKTSLGTILKGYKMYGNEKCIGVHTSSSNSKISSDGGLEPINPGRSYL